MAQSRAERAHTAGYAELLHQVQELALHRRRYAYYWTSFTAAAVTLAGLGAAVVLVGNSWFQLVIATLLAVVLAQLGFLGHDAAHRQVFASARWNEWAARIVSGLFAGLSYGWWVSKHNRHHSGPNQIGRDPDVGPGVLALTPQAAHVRTGAAAAFTRRQGWLLFLLLPFEGVNLHVQGVRRVLGRAPLRFRAVEAGFLAVRLGGYVTALLLMLPPGKAAAFLAVQLGVFGVLLGGAFAPNHIGMPVVPADARPDFLRRQVLMSRNVTGGPLVAFFMGGLQNQIEHHLFPNMPRPALARARPVVLEYCRRHGIGYTQASLGQAYGSVVRHLNTMGLQDRDPFVCPLVALTR